MDGTECDLRALPERPLLQGLGPLPATMRLRAAPIDMRAWDCLEAEARVLEAAALKRMLKRLGTLQGPSPMLAFRTDGGPTTHETGSN